MSIFVLVPMLYLAVVTVPLAVTDARSHRLPNALVVPGLVVSAWAVVGVGMRDPPAVAAPLAAAGAAALVFGAGRALGGVGMGDVKLGLLLAGVAGMTDARILPGAAGATAVLAGVSAATCVMAEKLPLASARIPLGPPLLGGFWCGVLTTIVAP
ncbi:prepilin peptidase [Herbiconiux sp. UC225_62]|uniref:prepilin peptidase n=1 Tax=Herbiconiux sp. UC225_62 TaxID=3350168 RepID=UPI0036D318D3